MRLVSLLGLTIGLSGCFINIDDTDKSNGWHSLDNRRGDCSSIFYGPLMGDKNLNPTLGDCEFHLISESIALDKRGLSNISKPRLYESKGYYNNREIIKLELVYALAAPDFYPEGAEGLGEYLDDIKDWNPELECSLKINANNRTYEVACDDNNIKISAGPAQRVTDDRGREYRLFTLKANKKAQDTE